MNDIHAGNGKSVPMLDADTRRRHHAFHMDPLVSLPRQALAELLRASGSPLTPEQFLATLPELTAYRLYASRARAAFWSKYVLLGVAVLGVLLLPVVIWISVAMGVWSLGTMLEDVLLLVGVFVVTGVEFRVHRYFREQNPKAPELGFRNQAALGVAILLYGLYHATFVTPLNPQTLSGTQGVVLSDSSAGIDPTMIVTLVRIFYLLIGVVGGVSQFALALYYRAAKNA